MTERELFEAIESLGGAIWYIEHEIYNGRMGSIFLKELKDKIKVEIIKTKEFGVDPDDPKSYWDWYNKMKYGTKKEK